MELWPGPHNCRTFEKVSRADYSLAKSCKVAGTGKEVMVCRAGSGVPTLCPFDEQAPEAKADGPSEKWGNEQEAE